MVNTALIIANVDDVHAHAVKVAVERQGGRADILDVLEFTESYDIQTRIGLKSADLTIAWKANGRTLRLDEISGLWWRRLSYPAGGYRKHDKPHSIFSVVREERLAALAGSLEGLVMNAFNDPNRSRQAAQKPTQLVRARELGLRVPETLITNSPDAVREFHERMTGSVVYKMFHGAPEGLYGTRLIREAEFDVLERLQACPAMFQEYIKGEFDVRAVVVGHEVFAAKLAFQPLTEIIDTRFVETEITPHVLPPGIAAALVELVAQFGLVYSAIDLRYSDNDGYVFFESNPEGQYLWIEIEAGLPISEAIAGQLLSTGSR